MSINLEQRYVKRYDSAVKILEGTAENAQKALGNNLEMVDLSNRLILTPTFIWERLFQAGLNPSDFWEKGLEAYEFATKWTFAFNRLEALATSCHPVNRKTTNVSLNGVRYKNEPSFDLVFKDLGAQADESLERLPNLAADIILPAISTEDLLLARYNLGFIKGRGKFPFDDLVDGSIQYRLPTKLEAVQACLTYPRGSQHPIASLRVNPLTTV